MTTYPVSAGVVTSFTWDYLSERPALRTLYEKGKASQWNPSTDIDWSPDVNFGEARRDGFFLLAGARRRQRRRAPGKESDATEALTAALGDDGRTRFQWEVQAWMVSQFLHGEQGALVAAGRLVETVPDLDAKLSAANQAADEARHVDAYAHYLNHKLGHTYPISRPMLALLTDIMGESRWDITYLGMQIIVEGLALAGFSLGNRVFQDPVIKQITDYVMRDEARHVAFGVLALQGLYDDMTAAELADREDFVIEATTLVRDRFLLDDVWERLDVDPGVGKNFALHDPVMAVFRQMLFSKIVPNLNKLGLLTERVRTVFDSLDILGARCSTG